MIRKSGTEPVVRVMAEGEDEPLVGTVRDNPVFRTGRANTARPWDGLSWKIKDSSSHTPST